MLRTRTLTISEHNPDLDAFIDGLGTAPTSASQGIFRVSGVVVISNAHKSRFIVFPPIVLL